MNSKKIAEIAKEKGALQNSKELSCLISFLRKKKLKTILEIGTAKGGTFYVWCKIAEPDATIISIDLPRGKFGGGYTKKDIPKFLKYKKKGQKLYFLMEDSHRVATKKKVEKIIDGNKIDFLFIDGDHRYRGAKRDFKLYAPLVKLKGMIALHDIVFLSRKNSGGVHIFWKELKRKYKKHQEFIHNQKMTPGIGVIRIKS